MGTEKLEEEQTNSKGIQEKLDSQLEKMAVLELENTNLKLSISDHKTTQKKVLQNLYGSNQRQGQAIPIVNSIDNPCQKIIELLTNKLKEKDCNSKELQE